MHYQPLATEIDAYCIFFLFIYLFFYYLRYIYDSYTFFLFMAASRFRRR